MKGYGRVGFWIFDLLGLVQDRCYPTRLQKKRQASLLRFDNFVMCQVQTRCAVQGEEIRRSLLIQDSGSNVSVSPDLFTPVFNQPPFCDDEDRVYLVRL